MDKFSKQEGSKIAELIEKGREQESLKTKYNTGSISETERRELQQLILKKSEIDNEDKMLLKNLSLKKD